MYEYMHIIYIDTYRYIYIHIYMDIYIHIDIYVVKLPWRRKWQPTPVFPPGESHGQRTLAGYSPWDGKESDMT